MRVKVILKSLLFSYAVTGVFLLFLAFLLFQFDLGETPIAAGIIRTFLSPWRIYGWKDYEKGEISLGPFAGIVLLSPSYDGICYCAGKTGYEYLSCCNHLPAVYLWRNFGRNAVLNQALKNKIFQKLLLCKKML